MSNITTSKSVTADGKLYRSNAIKVSRAILFNLGIWLAICTVGAAGSYQDYLKNGDGEPYSLIWLRWVDNHFPLMLLSSALFLSIRRYPQLIGSAKKIVALYFALTFSFFPLHILFCAGTLPVLGGAKFKLLDWMNFFLHTSNSKLFLEYSWFTGTFSVVIAVCAWHQGRARAASLQLAETANLTLHLALEQQRLRAIRQQLEPHFIFNALNAISALVRANEKAVALSGISQLSDLFRYALSASDKDWVTMEDEMGFIRDYLALQTLRYGDRLHMQIVGDTLDVMQCDCPPLLLQPLIENALRHDLDCHEGKSEIHLQFSRNQNQLNIFLRNTVRLDAAKNPGLGIGLVQTRTRLELLYKGHAKLMSNRSETHFELHICVPLRHPEN
ncbi:MAG: histidine kinase [Undibacterium sp.]|nr:histidine kinase [Undibacterium sp.]